MKTTFKKKKSYQSLSTIISPHGIIQKGTIKTGEEWKKILVYEVSGSFSKMFALVEPKETESKN
jgi:hypothetical protein